MNCKVKLIHRCHMALGGCHVTSSRNIFSLLTQDVMHFSLTALETGPHLPSFFSKNISPNVTFLNLLKSTHWNSIVHRYFYTEIPGSVKFFQNILILRQLGKRFRLLIFLFYYHFLLLLIFCLDAIHDPIR